MGQTNTQIPPELTSKILDNAPLGILISLQSGQVIWCNETLVSWLNLSREQLSDITFNSMMQQHLHPCEEQPGLLTVKDVEGVPQKWLHSWISKIDVGGNMYQTVYLTDVSNQVDLQGKLEQLESVEPISGLLNRRAMMQNLEPLVSRSRRYENPLSVIALGITNFEEIKSEHSQAAANHAILELSHLLKDQLRWADIVSRTDDDKIMVVLPETEKSDATSLANKINTRIATLHIKHDNVHIDLHTCFGVAAWAKGNDSLLLLRNANQALHSACEKGSGSIVTA